MAGLTIGQAMSYLGPRKAKLDLLDQAADIGDEQEDDEAEEEDEKGNKKKVRKRRKKKHPLEIDY